MADIPVLEAAPADKAKKGGKAEKTKDGKADKAAAKSAAAPAGKKKLLILIAAGVVALGGLGAGAFFMFGGKHDAPKVSATDAKGKSKAQGKQKAAEKKKEKEKEKEEPPPKGPPLFVALDPPFVVNFQAGENVRFLQIAVQTMSRDLETIEVLKANDPIIRNDLLLLFGNQSVQSVSTLEGKEKLRAQALETVRKAVTTAGGKPKRVEAVYFTSFVMQ
jgi:flagellar FliL protein